MQRPAPPSMQPADWHWSAMAAALAGAELPADLVPAAPMRRGRVHWIHDDSQPIRGKCPASTPVDPADAVPVFLLLDQHHAEKLADLGGSAWLAALLAAEPDL